MPTAYIVMWSKQGGGFPLSRASDYDGTLKISNVQFSDAGTYVCTGSNMHEVDRDSATLIVEEG